MGASSERIAIDITSSANVAEVAKARSEVSALGQTATKATDDLTASQKRMQQAIRESDGSLQGIRQRFRELTAEAKAATAAIGATESAGLTGGFGRVQYRAQSAGVAVLFFFESFARGANASEGPARAALRSIGLLAFALGPEVGIPIAGAAALGDAIFEMWSRTEKAAKDAQKQFQSTLETLARGSLMAIAQAKGQLYSGDPFAVLTGQREGESALQFMARSGGQVALEREQARLRAQVAEQNRLTNQGTTATTQQKIARDSYIAQLKEVNDLLATQDSRAAALSGVYDMLMGKEKEHAAFQLQQWRERAALIEARRLRPEEVPLGPGIDLGELNRQFGITGQRAGSEGVTGFGLPTGLLAQKGVDTAKIGGRISPAAIIPSQFMLMREAMAAESTKFNDYVRGRIGNTLADGLAAGITAGFRGSGIKNAFAAGSKVILAGFGGMLIDEGKVYLEKAAIMQALVPHLFNPATAGWAAAGIGAALIGLGAALEGLANSGGGRGGGGGYAGSGGTFTPNAALGSGGITLIVQTVDPYSKAVVNNTIYYINRAGMLNTPVVAPYGAPS